MSNLWMLMDWKMLNWYVFEENRNKLESKSHLITH